MATTWPSSLPAPDFVLTEDEVGIKTLISTGESGKERRRQKSSVVRRRFRLGFGILTTAQVDTLWTHYTERGGALKPFYWTRPARASGDSPVQYTVRFERDGLSRDWFSANLHKSSVTLVEVIGETPA